MGKKNSMYGRDEEYLQILTGKLEGKKSLGRHRHTYKNIKMDPKESRWQGMVWVHLVKERNQRLPPMTM